MASRVQSQSACPTLSPCGVCAGEITMPVSTATNAVPDVIVCMLGRGVAKSAIVLKSLNWVCAYHDLANESLGSDDIGTTELDSRCILMGRLKVSISFGALCVPSLSPHHSRVRPAACEIQSCFGHLVFYWAPTVNHSKESQH